MLTQIRNKQGAIELSIGTIVVIVIALTMLILGIILVRNIFSGSTESVNEINAKVQDEITKLFTDENKNVVVKLGSSNTARIKQDTPSFRVAIGAQTLDGTATNRDRMTYTLSLDENGDCIKKVGLKNTEDLLRTPINRPNKFDEFNGGQAFARVEVTIPDGTAICTQKVFIDVKDTQTNTNVGGSFFIIEIIKKGFF